jgi:hypothetical protein
VQQQQRRPFSSDAGVQVHAIADHGVGLKAVEHGRKLSPHRGNNSSIH